MHYSYRKYLSIILLSSIAIAVIAQDKGYWQQRADYTIKADFDVQKHQYNGVMSIKYTNNSDDDLTNAYFHLFFNAFQPNSMMDVRSRTIVDPDRRVRDRIQKLQSNEIGFQKIEFVKVNGKNQIFREVGTILEIDLSMPIKAGQTVTFDLKYKSQVPLQIRRSGRNNAEGIDYSMAQWYPKLCEYDENGWHPDPYVGREFYGVWGDFDVTIDIDSKYIVAATGTLQEPEKIGYNYADVEIKNRPKKHSWRFVAKNVHDFVWAADPDYKHVKYKAHDGTMLHFFYQPGPKTNENWEKLPKIMDESLRFMNNRYGKYAFDHYSFIQAGDGGMEYPMATLITGERPLNSLVGVSVHEWIHSWYHMVLATSEAIYPWMDEGCTTFGTTETMHYLTEKGFIAGQIKPFKFQSEIESYSKLALSGVEEPLTTHADHYVTNYAYGTGTYTKGAVTLVQLQYIVGDEVFDKSLLKYYDTWKFKHPDPKKFFRVFEKESNMVLDWFEEYWINSTHFMDYAVDTLINNKITIAKNTQFPMPIDLVVTTSDGKKHLYYIPHSLMRAHKKPDIKHDTYTILKGWDWTNNSYEVDTKLKASDIVTIEIDPTRRMADVNFSNNIKNVTNTKMSKP
jgi:Peptidase family M1 domain